MIEIYEIETFKLPDGTIYEIIPLPTGEVDLLLDFSDKLGDKTKLEQLLQNVSNGTVEKGSRTKKKSKAEIQKQETQLFEENKEVLKILLPIADEIIDKGTNKEENKETDDNGYIICDPLPLKYRNVANRILLASKIAGITMGNIEGVEQNPLPQNPANK